MSSSPSMSPLSLSYLSDTQEKALALLPIPSVLLSIISSMLLIRIQIRALRRRHAEHKVIRARRKRRRDNDSNSSGPFRRILLIMSVYDVINSINVAWCAFLVPADTSPRLWAFGNDKTCTAIAFIYQACFPSFIYCGILSFYFLLGIRFDISDEYIARNLEPYAHTVTIGFTLITACVGAALNLYGEVHPGPACWLVPTDRCNGACIFLLEWIFGGINFIMVWLFLFINNVYLFYYVAKTVRKSQQNGSSMSMEAQDKRKLDVAIQAFLYVAVFVMTFMWTFVLRVIGSDHSNDDPESVAQEDLRLYPLIMVKAFFLPLMGYGNLLVYCRPRYIQKRRRYRSLSRWTILKSVLLEEVLYRRSSNVVRLQRSFSSDDDLQAFESSNDGGMSIEWEYDESGPIDHSGNSTDLHKTGLPAEESQKSNLGDTDVETPSQIATESVGSTSIADLDNSCRAEVALPTMPVEKESSPEDVKS
ncbi:serpentine type 7TM GPCR chemoreceptor domain containing protein [Nitzschia inconspicua]|uniref:Serpentine type 7TM GPCR chemoreceptor domain containing protein n=1 Tax=Nitzschia inconspicua TaxID=303405 RepID=A0A9K3KA02_9STRA|nr:serpentine type 7TM GPCR chemoreceptor domain containing protein [Nitzschia inconspicua]KAG7362405.1 serpentine type 7TM GPCR chemoreceptor domain containing protein [Nitzschia inconspicua]